jgi:3-oxoadipate enol-lactonase
VTDHDIPTTLGRLRVTVAGDGEAVLLWPSLLMNRRLWDPQVAALSGSYRTVAVDPPGHGESAHLDRTFTLAECATCVVEILDHLDVDRAHVVGNSWGAMTGAAFAALHPDRVGRAILLNGTGSAAPRRQRMEYAALVTVARLLRGIRGPLVRPVVKAFLGPTSRRQRPEVVRKVVDVARGNHVPSTVHAVRSVVSLRPDQHELFGRIRCPVLVVAGREDATFPLPEPRAMADAIPGAELVVIEDAAHLAALEVPDLVNDLVARFLRTPVPPAGQPGSARPPR